MCPVQRQAALRKIGVWDDATSISLDRRASPFEQHCVAPDAGVLRDPLASADFAEPAVQKQPDAPGVLGKDARLQGPDAGSFGLRDQRRQQEPPDTAASRLTPDVDARFGDSAVDFATRNGRQGSPTKHRVIVYGDETRVQRVRRIPLLPARRGGLEGCMPGCEALLVCGEDRGPIARKKRTYLHRLTIQRRSAQSPLKEGAANERRGTARFLFSGARSPT